MGVLWAFQPGLAGDAPLQAQHEVGIRIPVILRLEVVELGLRMEALPQGRLTLGPGSYRLRIVSNTRWRLWLVPLLENPSSEVSSFLLEGRGSGGGYLAGSRGCHLGSVGEGWGWMNILSQGFHMGH
ncbi:hypothetical protein AN926_12550 [Thermus scotoductus]|uniref:Uncharacterized protein n=1 Tax=Thermus scotoductus TaxID=37636 RepID=A0A0N0ZMJ2_THESC|nr:hypothetical protein AN926_12550 [Thermus scotoductus]